MALVLGSFVQLSVSINVRFVGVVTSITFTGRMGKGRQFVLWESSSGTLKDSSE